MIDREITEEMAQVAAKWWSDRLRGPSKLDNADKSDIGAMTFMLGSIAQSKMARNRTPEQIDHFEKILSKKLQEYNKHWIGIDYGPWGIFLESAEEAGFKLGSSCLPWKTNMYFERDGEVKVSYGYGATPKTILQSSAPSANEVEK